MRRVYRIAGIALLTSTLLVVGFYTATVLHARIQTPELIAQVFESEAMGLTRGDLTDEQLHALLTVQDHGFFDHKGTNFSGGTMTTITQGLVKKFYFDDFEAGIGKIRQSLIARYALDPLVTKEDQLQLFLNLAYLGRAEDSTQVYGFAQGAEAFYRKTFDELTQDEFLALVAALPAPNRFNPAVDPVANAERVQQIVGLLSGRCAPGGLFDRLQPNCPD